MKSFYLVLTLLFGVLMVAGGISHFVFPEMYDAFLPEFLPRRPLNLLGGAAEIAVGIGVWIPRFRPAAALGILVLMVAFLPLHVIDVFREQPVIGSFQAALIRLPVQLLLIAWAWAIYAAARRRRDTPA
ncbi:MAG: hypothetical protein NW241_16970 [Bacteroidia bacterium]|nr:hypothetical protein [Bacteroidia bacterium]